MLFQRFYNFSGSRNPAMQNSGTPKSGKNLEKAWNFKESFWGFSCRFRCIKGSTSASFDGALRAPSNATGELPRWRSRHQNLHDNSQSDSLKFHAFSTFLPFFGVQKSCMGSLFFHPTIWRCFALKTYLSLWRGAPPGCWKNTRNIFLFPFGSLQFLVFLTVFLHFAYIWGPKMLHGIVFLLPAILMRFSTKNHLRSYPERYTGTWLKF